MSYYNEMIADIIRASRSSLTYEQVDEMVTQAAVAEDTDKLYILHCLKSVLDAYAAPALSSLDKLHTNPLKGEQPMGGRPSRATSKDKRLKENKPVKPKSATKVTPRKGGMTRAD